MPLDSAHLQEEDARRANRYQYSRHEPARPMDTRADAERTISQFVPLPPGRVQKVGPATLKLTPVGHLLGACAVTLSSGGQHIIFSGDLGRQHDLLMPPPQAPELGALAPSPLAARRHPC